MTISADESSFCPACGSPRSLCRCKQTSPLLFRDVIAALEARGSARERDLWACPAHADSDPSLHVTEGRDGIALLRDFGGCDFAAIVAALGIERQRTLVASSKPTGCTLAAYAAAKGLPAAFLKSVGLRQASYAGVEAVAIPYPDPAVGKALRFRVSLEARSGSAGPRERSLAYTGWIVSSKRAERASSFSTSRGGRWEL